MWQEKLGQLDLALAQLAEAEEKQKRELEKRKNRFFSKRSISFCGSSALGKMDTLQTHEKNMDRKS